MRTKMLLHCSCLHYKGVKTLPVRTLCFLTIHIYRVDLFFPSVGPPHLSVIGYVLVGTLLVVECVFFDRETDRQALPNAVTRGNTCSDGVLTYSSCGLCVCVCTHVVYLTF